MLRLVLLLGGIVLLSALLWQLGPSHVLRAVGHVGWYIVPVFLLGAANEGLRALALRTSVRPPAALPYAQALAIRLSGEAVQSLTFTGPALAQPTKAWLLESSGLTLQEGFAATLTEYLVASFVGAATSIVGLLYLVHRYAPPPALRAFAIGIVCAFTVFLIVSALAIARRFYLIGNIIAGLSSLGLLRGRLRPDMMWINQMEDLLLAVLRDAPARLAAIVAIEAATQGVMIGELAVLLRALGLAAPLLLVFVLEAAGNVMTFLFVFVPLQLGVSEGAYVLLFKATGLPAASGFAVAFLRRTRALAVAATGLAMLATLTRRQRRTAEP
jgi:glycosyltransferase 2 family protein